LHETQFSTRPAEFIKIIAPVPEEGLWKHNDPELIKNG
jgi:hypothetical protein